MKPALLSYMAVMTAALLFFIMIYCTFKLCRCMSTGLLTPSAAYTIYYALVEQGPGRWH